MTILIWKVQKKDEKYVKNANVVKVIIIFLDLCARKQTKNFKTDHNSVPRRMLLVLQQLSLSFAPQLSSVQTLPAKTSCMNCCASALPADSVAFAYAAAGGLRARGGAWIPSRER